MKKLHYGIVICIGCTLTMFCIVGVAVSAFPVYLPYMIEFGDLTKTQGSTLLSLKSLVSMVTMLVFVEQYYKRLELRLGMTLALACTAGSFCVYGISRGYVGYCAGAALSGIAYGLGGMIPVSILINRWFSSHAASALGFCAAGTGAAAIVTPVVVTALVRFSSLKTAFFAMAALIGLTAVVIFCILRNTPEEMDLTPYRKTGQVCPSVTAEGHNTDRALVRWLLVGVVLIGAAANGGYQHVTVLYTSEGFSNTTVSLLLSLGGILLTFGKCLYGRVTDRIGAYRAGYLFFPVLTVGWILCCLAGSQSAAAALGAMFCINLGLPLSTVGLSVFARDLSSAATYGKTVKNLQIAMMIGSFAFTSIPGMIADGTGSYVPAYVLITGMTVVAAVIVQSVYRNNAKQLTDNDELAAGILNRS